MKKIVTLVTILSLVIGITAAQAGTWSVDPRGNFITPSSTFSRGDTVGIKTFVLDQNISVVSDAQIFLEIRDGNGKQIASLRGRSNADGYAVMQWKTSGRQDSGIYTANLVNVIKSGYEFRPNTSITMVTFTIK